MLRVQGRFGVSLATAVSLFLWLNTSPRAAQPNIVVFLADDLGYGELGCQGNPQIPTPHIDSIAEAGVRFTSAYVTASYCSASRAGLMTGRFPTRFGYEYNPIGAANEDPRVGLPKSEPTLAQHLQSGGYATALVGKWHLGGTAAYHPLRRGFDEFFGFLHEGHYYVPPPYRGVTTMLRRKALPGGGRGRWFGEKLVLSTHMGQNEPAYDANNPIRRGGQPVAENAYLTDALTREAVDFLDRRGNTPFLLFLSYNAVHSPLQGADAYIERFAHIDDVHRRIFAAMLSNLDDSVGAILKKLRDLRVEENTLIFFLSDNGGPTRELTSSNMPLRGGKGDVYEGGLRVPFLVQWKDRLPGGSVEPRPICAVDLFATAAAAAGVPLPESRRFDGVDLLPFLTDSNSARPHEVLFWRMNRRTAVRVGDWKLLRNPRRGQGDDWELYHLPDDNGEANNLASRKPDRLQQLLSVWREWDAQMIAPAWRPSR